MLNSVDNIDESTMRYVFEMFGKSITQILQASMISQSAIEELRATQRSLQTQISNLACSISELEDKLFIRLKETCTVSEAVIESLKESQQTIKDRLTTIDIQLAAKSPEVRINEIATAVENIQKDLTLQHQEHDKTIETIQSTLTSIENNPSFVTREELDGIITQITANQHTSNETEHPEHLQSEEQHEYKEYAEHRENSKHEEHLQSEEHLQGKEHSESEEHTERLMNKTITTVINKVEDILTESKGMKLEKSDVQQIVEQLRSVSDLREEIRGIKRALGLKFDGARAEMELENRYTKDETMSLLSALFPDNPLIRRPSSSTRRGIKEVREVKERTVRKRSVKTSHGPQSLVLSKPSKMLTLNKRFIKGQDGKYYLRDLPQEFDSIVTPSIMGTATVADDADSIIEFRQYVPAGQNLEEKRVKTPRDV